jgi:hypothetical protein
MISLKQAVEMRAELIVEHKQLIAALDVLIPALRKREEVLGPPAQENGASTAVVLPLRPVSSPPVLLLPPNWPTDPRAASLKDYIVPLVKNLPDKPWTSREMCIALTERGVSISGSDMNGQINNVLLIMGSLAEPGGPLVQTVKGRGRRASEFKLRTPENELDAKLLEESTG